ncbi:MAG TPA: ribonuclease D [Candidatus Macondimonas sp.]|nr:ribonuclease D [Candidatus Macondimonas sp.]
MPEFVFIHTAPALERLVADWSGVPWLGLDTEFVRERTYHAQLCLIQLASPEGLALIDPLALPDWTALFALLDASGTVKILHAGGQDLELFHRARSECLPAPLFDTQIAASLLGHGQQIGYAALVQSLLGIALPKLHTRSDWSRRPLSVSELDYAVDDVRHLAALHDHLGEALERAGRLAWAEADNTALADPARYRIDPERAWLRIGAGRMLPPPAQGALRALAAWREREAQARDLPRQWLLRDEVLLRWAEQRPDSLPALAALAEVAPKLMRQYGEDWITAIREGALQPPDPLPVLYPLTPEQERRLKRLGQLVRARAAALGVEGPVLAPRRDLEALVLGLREVPVLQGWRRSVIGEELLSELDTAAIDPAVGALPID